MEFRHKPIIVTATPQNGENEITHTGNWILAERDGTKQVVTTEYLNKYYFKYFKIDSYFSEYLCNKLKLRESISIYDYNSFEKIVKPMSKEELFEAKDFAIARMKAIDEELPILEKEYKTVAAELAGFGAYQLHDFEYKNYMYGREFLFEAMGIFKKLINIINEEITNKVR